MSILARETSEGYNKAPPCSEIKVFVQLCEKTDDTNIQLAQEVSAASVHPHVSYLACQSCHIVSRWPYMDPHQI